MIHLSIEPIISVIMSVYNGETYLKEAIDSVIAQTFTQWELIVINDCSQDKTADILAEYALHDERIKVFTNEVNLKLPASLNKAISLSNSRYIARMDADDICLPDRLEKQFTFMEEHPDVSLSSCRFFTLKNGVISSGGCGGRCDSEALSAMLLVTNPILHPGVIAKADVMKQLQYDTTLTCTEDLELWTRMAKEHKKMQILPEYLLIYRLHDKQITSTTLERQHNEVLSIQNGYYGACLSEMDEERKQFYIHGIYFKEQADIEGFCDFLSWLKKMNKEKKQFTNDALQYAMFEMLAEYKRHGISKKQILGALLHFNPFFLIKEIIRKKISASRDGKACCNVAKKIGLIQTAGTKQFPIFDKINNQE